MRLSICRRLGDRLPQYVRWDNQQQRPGIQSRRRNWSLVATGSAEFSMRWFDALTGRIGYSWQPNSLLYFQGGAVWSRIEADLVADRYGHRRILQPARLPLPKPAGRLAVAGNINSRRSGRCLSKAITTTSARVIELYLPPSPPPVRSGCAFSAKATAATALIGVNYRFGGFGTGL